MPKTKTEPPTSSNSPGGKEFSVEKILNKKVIKGKVMYFLKWKGYPDSDNTWEKKENLNCPYLVAQYEERVKCKVGPNRQKEGVKSIVTKESGFKRMLEPDKILKATNVRGELEFLMKWKGNLII